MGEEEEEIGEKITKFTLDIGTVKMVEKDPLVCDQALVNAYLICVIFMCSSLPRLRKRYVAQANQMTPLYLYTSIQMATYTGAYRCPTVRYLQVCYEYVRYL